MTALRNLALAAATACLLCAGPASAVPNTWDLLSRSIPASACSPRDSAQVARLELAQGGWRFAGAATGRVVLTCPLPITVFPADQAGGFASTVMSRYRVWYRDSDGPGAVASVSVTPFARTAAGAWTNIGLLGGGGGLVPPGVCQFSSNAFADVAFAIRTRDCSHAIQQNRLYAFEVTLQRNDATQWVEFHGIDFDDIGTGPAG